MNVFGAECKCVCFLYVHVCPSVCVHVCRCVCVVCRETSLDVSALLLEV